MSENELKFIFYQKLLYKLRLIQKEELTVDDYIKEIQDKITEKENSDKKKYHFDEDADKFYSEDSLPFDNKIHPRLRHLHKKTTKLKCNSCGFMGYAEIHQDCTATLPDDFPKCKGLMCGF